MYLVVYDSIYFEDMCSCSETIFRCDFDVFGYKYWFLTCLEPSWEWQLVLHVLLTRSPLNIRSHTCKSCSSDTTSMSTTAIVTQLCVHPCNDLFNSIALCSWNDSVMIQAEHGLVVTYEAITSLILMHELHILVLNYYLIVYTYSFGNSNKIFDLGKSVNLKCSFER